MKLTSQHDIERNVITQSAEQAYQLVLSKAGASLVRDAIDIRTIEHTRKGTFSAQGSSGDINSRNGIIDKPSDVGGLSALVSLPALLDTDADGIPDEWEITHGLNPKLADSQGRTLSKEYDNIEVYCNSLVFHLWK
ncbi:thrombospondin type 3 repeat-containing protein [Pedobacter rhizosphaerae]|uniref:Uncharacterized protein n=1 Tax=Pedobacter rhizosphaerae TaxID=390241 RepID=A0A1H9PRD6_9SPHI|nr:thrombospondin type 3 repeat-containing protein [Pedobacter rhizosphaerae]SER50133.1 hypothetical protein SAMN04488023_11055 [Pedobacter rhizosphaerae]